MTLLLGPPGSGKTTLLLALAGKLGKDLKVSVPITHNIRLLVGYILVFSPCDLVLVGYI